MAGQTTSKGSSTGLEVLLIVAIALALAVGIQWLLVKPYRIPSESMEQTLVVGQRVLVNRIGTRFSSPKVGQVVVFHPPRGADGDDPSGQQCGVNIPREQICPRETPQPSEENFIKRIVAGPGDRVEIRDGRVIRNGRPQRESFVEDCGGGEDCTFREGIRVPPGHYFMMGDNRGQSDDSRFWGPVPEEWVIGNAFATYWPPKRLGIL